MVSGSFSAGCLEWPGAVSGCLAPAATFSHRPGDRVLHAGALRATSAKQVHAGLRPNVECGDQLPLTNEMTLRPSSVRVKSTVCVAACVLPRAFSPRAFHACVLPMYLLAMQVISMRRSATFGCVAVVVKVPAFARCAASAVS
jgi:hypothetical protein